MKIIKDQLIASCAQILKLKTETLKNELNDLVVSTATENKSTTGDKHETGRAMMQLEQEKLGKQLLEAESLLKEYERISFEAENRIIKIGSLVRTHHQTFFIAVPLGKIELHSQVVFVISPRSPLAQALLGKKQKDTVVFNGVLYEIINVD